MKEKVVPISDVKPGQYYDGRKITVVEPCGREKIWVGWEGTDYPRGSIFSDMAQLLISIFGGDEIIDGESTDVS